MAVSITSQHHGDLQEKDHQGSSWRRRALDLTRNVALLAALYLAYALVRRVTADDWSTALENGRRLLRFQESIGLPSEASLQSAFFLDRPGIVRAANAFYMGVHFPLTGVFLFWVWLRHRRFFPVIRNSLIALTMAGLVLHLTFPLAPPRFFPSAGFVDTAAEFGPNPYDLSAAKAANQIAAMPSLHVGWALLVAISIISLSARRYRFLALFHPVLTTSVVVLTANHYWADAIITGILVVGAWMFMAKLARLKAFAFHRSTEPELVLDLRSATRQQDESAADRLVSRSEFVSR